MTLAQLLRHVPAGRLRTLALFGAGFGLAAMAPAHAQAPAQNPAAHELVMTVGKSLVLNSATPIERVAVGFGDIAEARVTSPQEVLLDAKAPGETSLILWQQGGGKVFYDIAVQPNTAAARAKNEDLRRQLQAQLPGQDINAAMQNDTVFLTGTAKDVSSADRAVAIAGTAGKVVNLLNVNVPSSDPQILLKVQFATIDRAASLQLGANLIGLGAANTVGRVTTGQFSPPIIAQSAGSAPALTLSDALNIFLFRPDLNLAATIEALQTNNNVQILAEPNVLAINNKPASFLAGGEFPYPILQGGGAGLGTVTVAFREFGVRLGFLPMVTPRGTIRLDVIPEVSALDFANGLTIQGFTIPGLSVRRVQTEIELKPGQSFAIAGLIDKTLTQTIEKIPMLSQIPLLGKLFQSKLLNKNNTELLVIVTPQLVDPIPAGQPLPQLAYPLPFMTAGLTPPNAAGGPAAPPLPPAPATMPLESLLRSMKAESDMKLTQQGDTSSWPTAQQTAVPGMSNTPRQ